MRNSSRLRLNKHKVLLLKMYTLKLLRPINLLIITIVMIIIKYGFFERLGIFTFLSGFQFSLLVLSTILIAAGGNIINDIHDVETDRINKPDKLIVGKHISERKADYLYLIFTNLGIILGIILSFMIGHKGLATIFVFVSAFLYGYATAVKNLFFLGNLLVAGLVAFTPLVVVVFEIYPTIGETISEASYNASNIVLHFAFFAFCINLIRELIKDIQDTNGDKNAGRNTIPIILGQKRSTYIAFGLTLLLIIATIYYLYTFMYRDQWLMLYFLFTVIGPLLYISVKIFNAETLQNYKHIATVLKIIMCTGICTLFFISV